MDALNERSLSSEPFDLTVSKESIQELRMFLANLDRYLNDAKAAETAKNHEKAFRLYTKARNIAGRRRNASELAKSLEAGKLYGSACEYYEIAGKFDDAVRLRKEHPDMLEDSFAKLSSEDLYAKMALRCVRIRNYTTKSKSLGTGFFIKRGGYILTNNHVVEGAGNLEVVTGDGVKHKAEILAKSETPDLAVIKIELADHEVAKLGNAELVKIGTKAVLVGFPRVDLATATMNAGLISNTNRVFDDNPCYQLDISANHGNSGGPVCNDRGKVIGILTFGLGDSNVDRFNFAIRVDVVKKFLLEKMGKDFAEN